MERLREDLLQRARSQRQRDLEQGLPPTQEVVIDEPARIDTTRQSYEPPRTDGIAPPVQATGAIQDNGSPPVDTIDSPKSPYFGPPDNGSPFNRLSLAAFSRILPRRLQRRDSQSENNTSADAAQQSSSGPESEGPLPPEPVMHARSTLRATSSYYSTEESGLEATAPSSEESRPQRRHRRKKRRRHRNRQAQRQPTRFLGCLPWIQSKRMRLHAVRCFVSGLFLCILLTICEFNKPGAWLFIAINQKQIDLALSVTNQVDIGDITIVLILIVILATLFFAYSLIKLFLLVIRKDRDRNNRMINPWDGTSNDYAVPSQPIRVVLARDEEAAGVESEASKSTPPAYGVWRQSVVCWDLQILLTVLHPCLLIVHLASRPRPAFLATKRTSCCTSTGGKASNQCQPSTAILLV